jgi:YesN/AraC family two-component response regulator
MDTSSPIHISINKLEHGFRPHRHDFLEFSFVFEGSGLESINDTTHSMTPGTFTFLLPYQVHKIITDKGSKLQLYNCSFSMDLLMQIRQEQTLLDVLDHSILPPFIQLEYNDRAHMQYLIEDMYREYQSQEPWRELMLRIRLKEILIYFDRYRRRHTNQPIISNQANKKSATVWPIIHYIHRHYQENLTLADLTSTFSLSMSRISEVIKQTTGQTFVHFLHDLRLRHACSLLLSTDLSVSEIALEVGYGSYSTFSKIFKQSKGIVPKEYRKMKQLN